MSRLRPIVVGNWKMNGLKSSVTEFSRITEGYDIGLRAKTDLAICPPFTLLSTFAVVALGSRVLIGGQDCHRSPSGAHTGDVSAEMIADTGATHVIVGHSERRADDLDTNAVVHAKARAARRAGLVAILCIGESEAERDGDKTLEVLEAQLAASVPDGATADNLIIAYEPIWAIGSGRTPTLDEIAEAHAHIRHQLALRFGDEGEGMRILYGGSVKPSNAADILALANVNGALVGGASLRAVDFLGIAHSCP
jgi:triosephosphate isomerase